MALWYPKTAVQNVTNLISCELCRLIYGTEKELQPNQEED